jgi:acetone carboxylase gamma subunit
MVTCWECKREIYKKDVAVERTRWPRGKREYLCTDCKQKHVDAMIQRNRAELGLP